jgi:hypothetical protein
LSSIRQQENPGEGTVWKLSKFLSGPVENELPQRMAKQVNLAEEPKDERPIMKAGAGESLGENEEPLFFGRRRESERGGQRSQARWQRVRVVWHGTQVSCRRCGLLARGDGQRADCVRIWGPGG